MVATTPATRAGAAVWMAFAGLALGQLLVDIDDVVLNIALPSIASDVGLSAASVPWVVNAYVVCFGGLLLLGGRLADRYGHRAVLLTGVALFVVASLLGASASTPQAVLTSRAGQGLAAALLAPAAMSLLVHTFPDPEARARALGLWGAVTGLGAVLGLVVGGVVTEHWGWRWIFTGNAVAAVVVGTLVALLLPGGTGDRTRRVAPAGALLGVLGLVSLTWSLHQVPEHGWASQDVAVPLVVSAGALLACARVGRRSAAPLVPARLLHDRAVVVSDTCGAVVGAGLLGTFYFMSLHLQQVQGYTPVQAGLSYLPLVAALVLAAGLGSGALPRTGSRPMLVVGQLLCAAGLATLAAIGLSSEPTGFWSSLFPGLVVTGLGLGLAFVSLTATAVPGGEGTVDGGVASGLYNTALQVGGALGIAVLSGVARSRTEDVLLTGAQPDQAVTSGRVDALLVGSAILVVGALIATRMPRDAGRSARTDEEYSPHGARTS
jgi:EmrB/QacA subfamily drug resistance transporter